MEAASSAPVSAGTVRGDGSAAAVVADGAAGSGALLRAGALPRLSLQPGLHPVESSRQGGGVGRRLRPGHLEQRQLDDQPLLTTLTELEQGVAERVDGAEHVGTGDDVRQPCPLGHGVGGLVDDLVEVGGILGEEDAPEELHGLGDESPEVGATPGELGHQRQGGRGIRLGHGADQAAERLTVGQPQGATHRLHGDPSVPERRHLLQHRHGVTHRAVGVQGDGGQRVGVGLDRLGGGHRGEMAGHLLVGDRVEVEPLAPAADRVEQLVGLGGGQHEHDMVGWLFQRLEQGVARRPGEHVGLVEDVDPLRPTGGDGSDVDPDLPDVLDLVVRRRVELDDVERGALGDGETRLADVARLGRVAPLGAVERLGQQPGGGGLPGTAGPGEEIGVGDPTLDHLADQGLGDVVLADHLVEALRPVLAIQRQVVHRRRW